MASRFLPRLPWLVLALPALALAAQAASPDADIDLIVADSGGWSARLLVVVLAVTPLRRLAPRSGWTDWLVRQRRAIGVAAFAYAVLHLGLYLVSMAALAPVLAEALATSMLAGWLAFALMLPLAATSNAVSVRTLGSRWKTLHRLAYPAAGLALVHWLLVHDGAMAAWLTVAPLIMLQLLRFGRISIQPQGDIR